MNKNILRLAFLVLAFIFVNGTPVADYNMREGDYFLPFESINSENPAKSQNGTEPETRALISDNDTTVTEEVTDITSVTSENTTTKPIEIRITTNTTALTTSTRSRTTPRSKTSTRSTTVTVKVDGVQFQSDLSEQVKPIKNANELASSNNGAIISVSSLLSLFTILLVSFL